MMSIPVVALGGDLRVISLFDLAELLRLNGATGCLSLRDGSRRGTLYFDAGELINAVDDDRGQGEEAAIGLFGWRQGLFEFRAEPPVGGHVIESGTEAVMMEAARRLDELAAGALPNADDRETRRLQEHQAAMEALRDAFRRVAGEARGRAPTIDALAVTVHLYELTEPEDRLLYRPGHPPYLRRRGRWAAVPEPVLGPSDFEELRRRLTGACDPVDDGVHVPGGARRMTLANGRVLALEPIGLPGDESLWVRPVGAIALEPEPALTGDVERLRDLVARPESLLVLGAGDCTTARRLLAAAVGLAMGPADALVLVTADGGGTLRTPAGIGLAVTPAALRSIVTTVRPDLVALDPGLTPGTVVLEDLAAAPRILAAVVGTDAASLPARWRFRVRCHRPAAAAAWLRTMLRGIATARPDESEPGALELSAWGLEGPERDLALRGETDALGAHLVARPAR